MALVTGTNGKTTTTRLLAAALGASGDAVVSNDGGQHAAGPRRRPRRVAGRPGAVLEVDEVYLPRVLAATDAAAVVLLNLSRDQLDRINEVRMVAGRWRAALAAAPPTHGGGQRRRPDGGLGGRSGRPDVRWVGAGLLWQHDAVGCPACGGRIEFEPGLVVVRTGCGFARPETEARLGAHGPEATYRGEWADGGPTRSRWRSRDSSTGPTR